MRELYKFANKFGYVWPIGAPDILPSGKHVYSYTLNNPFVPEKPIVFAYTKKQIHDIAETVGTFTPYVPYYELQSKMIKRKGKK